MTDTTLTDLGPFFDRYDRRTRRLCVAAICASLVLSAVIVAHGALGAGGTGAKPAAVVWGLGVVFPPLFLAAWWGFTEFMARGRRRTSPPDGSLPTGADDARNGVRIANGGFVFNVVMSAAVIAEQAVMALLAFGHPVGDLFPRATAVAVGAVTIYLGNLWPRMPTSRAPEQQAGLLMKGHRLGGWLMVIVGLLVVLLGLFLPLVYPFVGGPRP